MKSWKLAQTGLFCALAIGIVAVEQLFPALPMLPPGAKPGFSNLVTMLAAVLDPGMAFCVSVGKSLFVGMTRGASAFCMSLVGGLLSTAVTVVLLKMNRFGGVGLGVAGACTHNVGQILAASAIFSSSLQYYLPWMLFFGIITGILTGVLFGLLRPRMEEILLRKQQSSGAGSGLEKQKKSMNENHPGSDAEMRTGSGSREDEVER